MASAVKEFPVLNNEYPCLHANRLSGINTAGPRTAVAPGPLVLYVLPDLLAITGAAVSSIRATRLQACASWNPSATDDMLDDL